MLKTKIAPRLIRLVDAPAYVGMGKNIFNTYIRPYVLELRIGGCVSYDKHDLDKIVDVFKQKYGRPAEVLPWETNVQTKSPASRKSKAGTTLTKRSKDMADFASARENALKKKR